jgi:hypothetical protein
MSSAQPPFSASSQSDLLERVDKVVTAGYERMQSYSRVVIGLAYAGLLAVWSSTKQVLPERLLILSGLLIILSILAYVIFEVGQMLIYAWMGWRYAHTLAKKGVADALSEVEQREKRVRAPLLLSWLIMFALAAVAGFGAAGILVYAFCRRLLRLG